MTKEIIFDCCDEPRVQVASGATCTLIYYTPILDKYGNNTNPDRNKITAQYSCLNCGKIWSESK